jgi:hypothetical protein
MGARRDKMQPPNPIFQGKRNSKKENKRKVLTGIRS